MNLIKSRKCAVNRQSQDELEQIAKKRKFKNYEKITKEELIISLLKSKQSVAEHFNILITIIIIIFMATK